MKKQNILLIKKEKLQSLIIPMTLALQSLCKILSPLF